MPNKTSNDYFAFCIFCSVCVFIIYLCCWFSYIYILYFFRFHPFLVDLSSQILYYFSFLSCIHIILLLAFVFFFISFYSRSLYFFCCWYHNFSSRAFFSLRIIILFIFFSFLHFCVIHIHNVIYIFFSHALVACFSFFFILNLHMKNSFSSPLCAILESTRYWEYGIIFSSYFCSYFACNFYNYNKFFCFTNNAEAFRRWLDCIVNKNHFMRSFVSWIFCICGLLKFKFI